MKRSRPPEADAPGRDDALACVPVKNPEIREDRNKSGAVLLTYPVRPKKWMAGLARRLGSGSDGVYYRKLELDDLGSRVWEIMDGRRPVKTIIDVFAEELNLHPKEAEVSVTAFIRELGKRGLIGLK